MCGTTVDNDARSLAVSTGFWAWGIMVKVSLHSQVDHYSHSDYWVSRGQPVNEAFERREAVWLTGEGCAGIFSVELVVTGSAGSAGHPGGRCSAP